MSRVISKNASCRLRGISFKIGTGAATAWPNESIGKIMQEIRWA